MKRVILLITLTLLLTSLASAEMYFKEQPNKLYNFGELVGVPIKITTTTGITDSLYIRLICGGIEKEITKTSIFLFPGEEKDISEAIPLVTNIIGNMFGTCKIKAVLGQEYILSEDFSLSNKINIELKSGKTSFEPEEEIIIEGSALKENKKPVNGHIEAKINGIETIFRDTIKNGFFSITFSVPKNTKSGQHIVNLEVYEIDLSGNRTNQGIIDSSINIVQIPNNIEIVIEETFPGKNLKLRPIMYDQAGDNIETEITLTLKDEKNKIIEKTKIKSNEYFEYYIPHNQPPVEWNIFAEAMNLEKEETFNISVNRLINIEIINRTIEITNMGNVIYNESVLVKIGNETLNLDVYLGIDEIKKFKLSAPEGEYDVQIIAGDDTQSKTVLLTGNAIKVDEIQGGSVLRVIKFPFVWIFIILILAFLTIIVFKKGYRQTFIGYITKYKKPKKTEEELPLRITPNSLIKPSSPAILSLSIQGEKQDTSILCLKLKNKEEIQGNDIAKEVLQKITSLAEENKAVTYQNQNDIIFMWVPLKTKTFQNHKKVLEVAQEAKELLDKYNKIAKKKIDYGISANHGTIIAKPDKSSIQFMSMGLLITDARKLSTLSTGEIYLGQKIYEKAISNIKAKKHESQGNTFYTIEEMKTKSAETKKFIHNFIEKLEKENKR